MLVDISRAAHLLDLATIEDRDPVAHRQGLFLIVRDEDKRDPDLAAEAL